MKRILKHPITMLVIGFFAGVALADKVKPMLQKIPMVGKLFGGF